MIVVVRGLMLPTSDFENGIRHVIYIHLSKPPGQQRLVDTIEAMTRRYHKMKPIHVTGDVKRWSPSQEVYHQVTCGVSAATKRRCFSSHIEELIRSLFR